MAVTPLFFKIDSAARTPAAINANIASLDAIISELLNTALVSVQKGNISEYELNTGQSTTKLKYASTTSVLNSIQGYERLRKMYENMLVPRMVRLMDQKNFR